MRTFKLVRSSLILVLAPLAFLVAAQAQNTAPAPTRQVQAPPTIAPPSEATRACLRRIHNLRAAVQPH